MDSKLDYALNKLAKWRKFFASWQLGTRDKDDPEYQAVANHRELSILLRADVNALTRMMVEKGVMTVEEWQAALLQEAQQLERDYEAAYPGWKATEHGMAIDLAAGGGKTVQDMNWRP